MRQSAFHILRVGVAITFLWIGVLILKNPQSFSGLLENWASNLISHFGNLNDIMIGTAIFDLLIGFLLLINRCVLIASLLGFLHLLSIVITTAILVTVRDIGLMSATLALALTVLPYSPTSPFVWPKTLKEWLELLAR